MDFTTIGAFLPNMYNLKVAVFVLSLENMPRYKCRNEPYPEVPIYNHTCTGTGTENSSVPAPALPPIMKS